MWINTTITTTFPMIVAIVSQRRLLEFCLAQLVYHKVYIESWDENHVIRTSCQLFRDNELTAVARDHTIVVYPWTEGVGVYSFTGIPAHVAVLHEIRAVAERQRNMVDQLLERLVETLDQRGIAGGVMSEQRLRDIVIHATQDIRDRMTNIAANQGIGPELAAAQARSQAPPRSYSTHMHGGKIHLLPEPWRFPSVGVLLLWQHWLLGNYTQNVPPLRVIKCQDVAHLDKLTLKASEKRPRPARKILHDMKFLMEHVEEAVRVAGTWTCVHNVATVTEMFQSVEDLYKIPSSGEHERRDSQIKWQTIVTLVRKKDRQVAN